MRYLIDEEFRKAKREAPRPMVFPYAASLRRELSERNIRWAIDNGYAHEISMGKVPAVLFREDDSGNHGNFLPETYRRIQQTPDWSRRLSKVHISARRALQSHDPGRMELDSSNSSDALLMNVFCDPDTLTLSGVRELLGLSGGVRPVFGYRPGVPLSNRRRDCTEIDMLLGDLLVEAKLTEYDFQTAPWRLIERYRYLKDVFAIDMLDIEDGVVLSYQLIRSVLAVYAVPGRRFCVLCDRRRPDLIDSWYRIMTAVKLYDLRCRLQLLTWQELAAALSTPLKRFLEERYGVMAVNQGMAIGEDDLLAECPPGHDPDLLTADEFFACPVGEALWARYRRSHLEAPATPPACAEDMPDADEYWEHANACDDCNEV